MRAIIATILCLMPLNLWAFDEPTATERSIGAAISENLSGAREYWISTINAMGDKERVAVVFGMTDNLAFCEDLLRPHKRQHPDINFFCEPAN